MKNARYMTLAAVLFSLIAVAPVRADASKAELQNALVRPYDATVRAYLAARKFSPTYGQLQSKVEYAANHGFSTVSGLKSDLLKTGPINRGKMIKDAKFSIDRLEYAIDRAEDLEEEADDRDDDANETKAKKIQRDLRNAKSQMRDFLKLID